MLEKLVTFSWMTKPQKRITDLFQYLRRILQNDKERHKKEELLTEKNDSIILSDKKKIITHGCLQKLAPF